ESRAGRVCVEVHGKEGRLTVTDTEVVLTRGGQDDQKWQYQETEQLLMERLLSSFALSLLTPDQHEFPGAESLKNMAVLESAYLSAKTGFPEEPARILRMAGRPASPIASV
ncbi:MAG: hypothetical protein ABFE01_21180, partial [Phycisphaerales bacterium]